MAKKLKVLLYHIYFFLPNIQRIWYNFDVTLSLYYKWNGNNGLQKWSFVLYFIYNIAFINNNTINSDCEKKYICLMAVVKFFFL